MCGISGILTADANSDRLKTLLQRMQTALLHRGPDDAGVFVAGDRTCALAHTRLSILDLSAAGHQPMSTVDGRYWITFNGEIYNFRQLRAELEADNEQFNSNSDTEVILKLFQREGADCLHRLRGMFAFAIWDDHEKTCFLARDPLGIKPLYYWQSGSTLVFASEIRAILATRLPALQLSAAGLHGYLVSGAVPEPFTLIEGIRCLEAGNYLTWKAGSLHQTTYWKMPIVREMMSAEDARERVRSALFDSIQHHFVSDVPVGLFLSGGIDSSAVLALASYKQSDNLRTYSIAFEENQWNEGDIAQKVANHFGAEHTELKVTATTGRELLPQFLEAIDQPSVDGFNTFCVSRLAHDSGTKVVLSGLGGDELFGGYGSFYKIPKMMRLGKALRTMPLVSQGVGRGLETWSTSTPVRRMGDFLQQVPTPAAAYRSMRGVFSHQEACAIARHYLPDTSAPSRQAVEHGYCFPSIEDEVGFLELSRYMRNQLLRDSDVMSMHWGLELRVPLVDRHLIEAIAPIPSHLRLAIGKKLLIDAVPELPTWVTNRPKRGFTFPFEQWLSNEWEDYFNDFPCPSSLPLPHWSRRWSLAMLHHWWQRVSA